jgi:hypothetical protein
MQLLQKPMQDVKIAMPDGVVVVIDALDECDDGDAFRLFLEVLLKLAVDLPIKVLITSRPEPAIRKKMLAPGHSRYVLHLQEIDAWMVETDIKKYLKEALGSISPPHLPTIQIRLQNVPEIYSFMPRPLCDISLQAILAWILMIVCRGC